MTLNQLMIWLYRLLFLPVMLVSAPKFIGRMIKRGGYGRDFRYRFGFFRKRSRTATEAPLRIWLHAVSVGELLAAAPLIKALKDEGQWEVALTTTTSTGYDLAEKIYRDWTVEIGWFPMDFWPFSALAWSRLQPDMALLMESELWPEHLYQANLRDVPVILINARLSDRSFRRYSKTPIGNGLVFEPLDRVLVASRQDRQRFADLGIPSDRLVLTGNLKFDVAIEPILEPDAIVALHVEMGFTASGETKRPLVLLGSSTWPGEEAALLLAFEEARAAGIDCRLLLVPRHAERRDEIKALLETQDEPFHFRSTGNKAPGPCTIYVGDTTGELKILTQAADLVFVGKTLGNNRGGQTPIEAAALGKPIVFGPRTENFREICTSLEEIGAAHRVVDPTDLRASLRELLENASDRERMAKAAESWHRANRGAVAATLDVLREYSAEDSDSEL